MKYDSYISNLPALQSKLSNWNNAITLGNAETARTIYCVANELAELNRKLDALTDVIAKKDKC